jgi:hypothetical protein
VLVVVTLVGVRHRDVPTALAVAMLVLAHHRVPAVEVAFLVVAVVRVMPVTVLKVVDMPGVLDRGVAAPLAVNVLVAFLNAVRSVD